MHLPEKPTNTVARASNGPERSRWRDEGVDPELVADPFDTLQQVRAAKDEASKPLTTAVAETAMQAVDLPGPTE